MAKINLPTNFQDDIMSASMNGKRKYTLTQNTDGTVSLDDVTEYDQVGSNFGAGQINATNNAVNQSADAGKIIDDMDSIMSVTQTGYMVGALAAKELKKSVADGKSAIASAITSKGVSTAASASFATMANNIKNIQTTPIVTSYSRSPGDASFKYTLFTADKNGTVSTYAYGHPGDGTASCYVRINGAIQSNGVYSINAGSVVSVEGTNNGSYTRTMYSVVYVRV